jgi:hypothetical protein
MMAADLTAARIAKSLRDAIHAEDLPSLTTDHMIGLTDQLAAQATGLSLDRVLDVVEQMVREDDYSPEQARERVTQLLLGVLERRTGPHA